METIYDWLTLGSFAGLVVLFLQRSTSEGEAADGVLHYMPPAIGCAVTNYLGNEGHDILAIAAFIAVWAYIVIVLKPFPTSSR